MTKKDYKLIAEAIRDAAATIVLHAPSAGHPRVVAAMIATSFTEKLHADNPLFDADRFIRACTDFPLPGRVTAK